MPPVTGTPIGKLVAQAIDQCDQGNFDHALIFSSIAVDTTAAREFPHLQGPGKAAARIMGFTDANLPLIIKVGTDGFFTLGSATQFKFNYKLPGIKPDPDGTFSFRHVFYSLVRCGLIHNGVLPPTIVFHDSVSIFVHDDHLGLPKTMLHGLVVAVVLAPVNSKESLDVKYVLRSERMGLNCVLNELWGKRDEFKSRFVIT